MQVLRTLFLYAVAAALTAAQSDVLFFTRVPNPITDGEQAVILWSTNDTNTDVTLTLLRGTSAPYDTVCQITNTAQNGQYIWEPPSWIANGDDYRLEISNHELTLFDNDRQARQVNTFGPLSIQGANPSAVESHSESIAASISASISRSVAASINASISSSLSAANATANSTATGTGARKTTNSQQTTPKATHATTTTTGTADGQGSKTGSAASSSSSGALAPTNFSLASSAITLILGAVAALFYLQ